VLLDAATEVAGLLGNNSFHFKVIIASKNVVQREVFLERCLGDVKFVLDVPLDAATKVAFLLGKSSFAL